MQALEARYNESRPFPQAYREFLFLGGRHCNLEDLDQGLGFDWLQATARQQLAEAGQHLDRPFWVIYQLEGCQQFGLFYLDDAQPNPAVYHCMPAYVEFGDPLIQPLPQPTFSRFIEECVARSRITDQYLRG